MHTDDRPHLKLSINNFIVGVLIDTGAESSTLTEQVAKKLKLDHLINRDVRGRASGVGTAKIVGIIEDIHAKIGNIDFPCFLSFSIIDTPSDIILLGVDFLELVDAQISIRNRTIQLKGRTATFLSIHEMVSYRNPIAEREDKSARFAGPGKTIGTTKETGLITPIETAIPVKPSEELKSILIKIISNIVCHINDESYRCLRLDGVEKVRGCRERLESLGFEYDPSILRLVCREPDLPRLNEVLSELID